VRASLEKNQPDTSGCLRGRPASAARRADRRRNRTLTRCPARDPRSALRSGAASAPSVKARMRAAEGSEYFRFCTPRASHKGVPDVSGTSSSNPLCSSKESANFQSLSGGRIGVRTSSRLGGACRSPRVDRGVPPDRDGGGDRPRDPVEEPQAGSERQGFADRRRHDTRRTRPYWHHRSILTYWKTGFLNLRLSRDHRPPTKPAGFW